MGTFVNGESGSSVRTKINSAIEKTEGTAAISTIDVDGGAIDGVTLGTNSAITEAQVDNININGNTISSTDTNGDITIDPNGTGDVNIGNFKFDADQTIGAGQDNYVLTYDNTGGKISLEAAPGAGGGISNVVEDTTPQLGGDLDVNGNALVSTSSGTIDLDPHGWGKVTFKGNLTRGAGQFVLNCEQNTHGITIQGPPHSAAANYTLTLPDTDGSANQVLKTDGTGDLDWVDQPEVVDDTTPQLGGNLDLNSNNITGTGDITPTGDIKPTTYQETVGTESSGTLDLSTGNVFSHAPSANTTYVFSNPPSTGTAFGFTLKVSPSATITQTWPASVDWAGGSAPTATASGETDVFAFYTQDGGTTYYGFQAGDAMA